MKPNRRKWLRQIGLAMAGTGLAQLNIFASSKKILSGELSDELITPLNKKGGHMKLGAFSISLSVKDLEVSKQFYENLGFTVFAGDKKSNYLIMKSDDSLIGLFQGMFEKNILTFNPGWDQNAKKLDKFEDVREIQRRLKSKSIQLQTEADEKTTGPASFVVLDPDGNTILFDQHV